MLFIFVDKETKYAIMFPDKQKISLFRKEIINMKTFKEILQQNCFSTDPDFQKAAAKELETQCCSDS